MSKRRKNAGEGYGYMFHGSFGKKADAVAKERKTKGAWIKPTLTNQGYRYIVMSPRTNPIKRKPKPKVKKETQGELLKRRLAELNAYTPREKNPTELLVMGANPHERKIEIPNEGDITITIRRNNPVRTNSLGTFLGFSPKTPTKKELAESRRSFKRNVREKVKENDREFSRLRKSARVGRSKKLETLFHEVYGKNPAPTCGHMIGGEPCTRKPGHRGSHLPQGATMRTQSRLRHSWKPRGNPTAGALREKFTGKEVDRIKIYDEPHMPAGDYAQLGKLLSLFVKPLKGGQVQEIRATGVTVVSDESARQIYFVGGDQDVSAALAMFGAVDRGAGLYELGEARRIDYKQRKEHVPQPDMDSWRHEFGEETGVRPTVLFDVDAKRLLLEGGEYVVREEGIIN